MVFAPARRPEPAYMDLPEARLVRARSWLHEGQTISQSTNYSYWRPLLFRAGGWQYSLFRSLFCCRVSEFTQLYMPTTLIFIFRTKDSFINEDFHRNVY